MSLLEDFSFFMLLALVVQITGLCLVFLVGLLASRLFVLEMVSLENTEMLLYGVIYKLELSLL